MKNNISYRIFEQLILKLLAKVSIICGICICEFPGIGIGENFGIDGNLIIGAALLFITLYIRHRVHNIKLRSASSAFT